MGLPSSKQIDKGLRVREASSHGGNIASSLSRDDSECYLEWMLVLSFLSGNFPPRNIQTRVFVETCLRVGHMRASERMKDLVEDVESWGQKSEPAGSRVRESFLRG